MGFLKRLFGKKISEENKKQPAPQTPPSQPKRIPLPKTTKSSLENSFTESLPALLSQHFNIAELKLLCVDLNIDWEFFPGDTKLAKIIQLVSYFSTPPRQINQLVDACQKSRPNVNWHSHSTLQDSRLAPLSYIIRYCFNANELRDLCLKLGIHFERLAGSDVTKSIELTSIMFRHQRVDEFLTVCSTLRPKAPWYSHVKRYEPYSLKQLAVLQQLLSDNFSEDTVRQFCEALDVDFKRLPEWESGGVARELVLYLARRERLDELIVLCTGQLPEIPWNEVLSEQTTEGADTNFVPPTTSNIPEDLRPDHAALRQALAEMDNSSLRTLCFDLSIDHENIPGVDKRVGLLMLLERQKRIPELIEYLKNSVP
jgi:hypothetical protein